MQLEALKQALETLSEEQLQKVAEFVSSTQEQVEHAPAPIPFWQSATPEERVKDFRDWVSQLPGTGVSLPDEALSRDSIYE